jgi:mannose-6-phosphate isomerase-like protein (cupin superfamily)
MADEPYVNEFSHVSAPRHRRASIGAAREGQDRPGTGTGWHVHRAQFHVVIVLKGWARFTYEGKETLVSAGDCVHHRPGIVHNLFDYSPDMESIEVVIPADLASIDVGGPAKPAPTPWS